VTSSTPAAGHAGAITTKNVHDKATASDNNSKITKCGWSTSDPLRPGDLWTREVGRAPICHTQ
jgi:hypothetical protein